jgi:DNA repair protein RecO (recombination protein O)
MHKSRAIVLHQLKYSETSLIVKMFTEKEGLLSFIVKGVRGKKGKMRTAQFQALNLLEVSYNSTKKSNLRYLTELRIAEPFTSLLFNPVKRSMAMFISELIQKCIKEEEANCELFRFLFSSIQWLDLSKVNSSHFHLYFMMKFTKYLGFFPMLEGFRPEGFFDLEQGTYLPYVPVHQNFISGNELLAWKELAFASPKQVSTIQISQQIKRCLLDTFMIYYQLHMIHFKELNSHHVMQTIFEDD